jgi:SMODS-associated and fused to various effectors sensor domain
MLTSINRPKHLITGQWYVFQSGLKWLSSGLSRAIGGPPDIQCRSGHAGAVGCAAELNGRKGLLFKRAHGCGIALVVALSGTVTPDRILRAMGKTASIWSISSSKPHNDFIKTKAQLSEFRSIARGLFDEIKATHGNKTVLHVFPAAAVSVAVEFGRVRMPKADMPWRIYDQVNDCGGFVAALDVPFGDNN